MQPLLTRPGAEPRRQLAGGTGAMLAEAAMTCARARFPVDAAISLATELLLSTRPASAPRALRSLAEPATSNTPAELRPWLGQLEHGCSWYEHDLPWVRVPGALASAIAADVRGAAVEFVGDRGRLRDLLRAERIAVRSNGLTLGAVLAAARGATQTRAVATSGAAASARP